MFDKVAPGIFCLCSVHLSTDGQSTAFQILLPLLIFDHPHCRKKVKTPEETCPDLLLLLVTTCLLPLILSQ